MKPFSQSGITVEIKNPQGITVSSDNMFLVKGMKSGRYTIPEIASPGIWKVVTRFSNTPQKTFTADFEVKEYYARCKKFYHPERTDGALYKLCKGDLCLCAEENCSFQKKNRVRDEERLNRACESGVDYVYKVTVDSDIYDMKVEQVLRKGTDEEVEGKVRPFLARPSCREYLGLVNGKSYLIMGKSVDLPMLGGSQQYIFGQQTWVEYWPTREESQTLEHRKRYIGIIELMNSLFRHGCAV
ncbi:hypothetical protein G5714_000219 [Onychostoma macrolepis]|uniref:NTR domain-containing protein n=1 Tax=Onychostoma macrolepis TaxID=369639 RepID=A0A7J6DFQ6_9TELE|nr:hypothetical protein G5714_000219 [Onychostoma macrolepis]